jgi:hypothetical protein
LPLPHVLHRGSILGGEQLATCLHAGRPSRRPMLGAGPIAQQTDYRAQAALPSRR